MENDSLLQAQDQFVQSRTINLLDLPQVVDSRVEKLIEEAGVLQFVGYKLTQLIDYVDSQELADDNNNNNERPIKELLSAKEWVYLDQCEIDCGLSGFGNKTLFVRGGTGTIDIDSVVAETLILSEFDGNIVWASSNLAIKSLWVINPARPFLGRFLRRLPQNLTALHLVGCDDVTTADIEKVSVNLMRLDVEKCAKIELVLPRLGLFFPDITTNWTGDRASFYRAELSKRVIGQPEAVVAAAEALVILDGRPEGMKGNPIMRCFVGLTGVGKTELAKAISKVTGRPLKFLSMENFKDKMSVSELRGAPPGYIGYGNNDTLVDWVVAHPNGIVLFDEIEKAHPEVQESLLGLLDEGKLIKAGGNDREKEEEGERKTADFGNCLVLLTSNLCSEEIDKLDWGKGSNRSEKTVAKAMERSRELVRELMKTEMSYAFAGRLASSIVPFRRLNSDDIRLILADKLRAELDDLSKSYGCLLLVTDDTIGELAMQIKDIRLGFRPLWRTIQDGLMGQLSRLKVANAIKAGDVFELFCPVGDRIIALRLPKSNAEIDSTTKAVQERRKWYSKLDRVLPILQKRGETVDVLAAETLGTVVDAIADHYDLPSGLLSGLPDSLIKRLLQKAVVEKDKWVGKKQKKEQSMGLVLPIPMAVSVVLPKPRFPNQAVHFVNKGFILPADASQQSGGLLPIHRGDYEQGLAWLKQKNDKLDDEYANAVSKFDSVLKSFGQGAHQAMLLQAFLHCADLAHLTNDADVVDAILNRIDQVLGKANFRKEKELKQKLRGAVDFVAARAHLLGLCPKTDKDAYTRLTHAVKSKALVIARPEVKDWLKLCQYRGIGCDSNRKIETGEQWRKDREARWFGVGSTADIKKLNRWSFVRWVQLKDTVSGDLQQLAKLCVRLPFQVTQVDLSHLNNLSDLGWKLLYEQGLKRLPALPAVDFRYCKGVSQRCIDEYIREHVELAQVQGRLASKIYLLNHHSLFGEGEKAKAYLADVEKEMSNPEAQIAASNYYRFVCGNNDKASSLVAKLAADNYPPACKAFHAIRRDSNDKSQVDDDYWASAAAEGDAYALYMVGKKTKNLTLLLQAAAQEEPLALLAVAGHFKKEGDSARALAYFERGAIRHQLLCAWEAGSLHYAAGRYVNAFRYLKIASDQRYAPAEALLGECCEFGRGTDRNSAKAGELYRRSIDPHGVQSKRPSSLGRLRWGALLLVSPKKAAQDDGKKLLLLAAKSKDKQVKAEAVSRLSALQESDAPETL